MNNDKNWRLLFLFQSFLIHFCLFLCSFFNFFRILCFVTTTPDKFQFQCQVSLSRIKPVVPIGLKIKLCVVVIEWGSRINFLFLWRKRIVNSCPTWLMRNVFKNFFSRPTGFFANFVGMTLLAVLSLIPLLNCFLRVCLPTVSAAVSFFFQPPTTSEISGASNSNMSAPTRFAAGTRYSRTKKELQFSH